MKTIVFFNNKGGVGKTTLTYHLAHMLARQGHRVLAADLDPQANLTSAFLDEDALESIWEPPPGRNSVLSAVYPILTGEGDIAVPDPLEIPVDIDVPEPVSVTDRLWLLAGDLGLSRFEDRLSDAWPRGYEGDVAALRATTAFHRLVTAVATSVRADVALVDVGPNLGAINRSALLAADYIIVPLAADLFSLQGLRNLGPAVRAWRLQWTRIREHSVASPMINFDLPTGAMHPAGYVVLQHAVRLDRPVKAYDVWLSRIPGTYSEHVLGEQHAALLKAGDDPNCLATLRNYRSLMPYAQEARKPMFDLKPADGAIGGHQKLVQICYGEFEALAKQVTDRCNVRQDDDL